MALILFRKPGEAFRIGDSVIRVMGLRRDGVTLRITAPADVRIVREEIEGDDERAQALYFAASERKR